MELNVWTSTTVQKIERDNSKDDFVVTLAKADVSKRVIRPKHVVAALGLGANEPSMPDISGMGRVLRPQSVAGFFLGYLSAPSRISSKVRFCTPCLRDEPQIIQERKSSLWGQAHRVNIVYDG